LVAAAVHFKSLDAGDKRKEFDTEFEQQRKAVIEAAVQQQTQSARSTTNTPAVKQVGRHFRNASDLALFSTSNISVLVCYFCFVLKCMSIFFRSFCLRNMYFLYKLFTSKF